LCVSTPGEEQGSQGKERAGAGAGGCGPRKASPGGGLGRANVKEGWLFLPRPGTVAGNPSPALTNLWTIVPRHGAGVKDRSGRLAPPSTIITPVVVPSLASRSPRLLPLWPRVAQAGLASTTEGAPVRGPGVKRSSRSAASPRRTEAGQVAAEGRHIPAAVAAAEERCLTEK